MIRRLCYRTHASLFGRSTGGRTAICWISIPRTGSTYLCDVLQLHPNITSHYEVFHRRRMHLRDEQSVIPHVNATLGQEFKGCDDPTLQSFSRKNPAPVIQALRDQARPFHMSFKLFRGHLRWHAMRATVLADPGIVKVLFKREPLHTYISKVKARTLNQWEFTDTTKVKPTLQAEDFAAYVQNTAKWFQNIHNYIDASGQIAPTVHYETLTSKPTNSERLTYLIDQLKPVIELPNLEGSNDLEEQVGRKKQDQSSHIRDKVQNFEEFRDDLSRIGFGRYLESAIAADESAQSKSADSDRSRRPETHA